MSNTIQTIVNSLPLPYELSDEINSYLFYDKKTAQLIRFIKNKKKVIVTKFYESLCCSRNIIMDNEYEYWIVCLTNVNFINEIITIYEPQIHGVNCKKCGNYKLTSRDEIPENIKCRCLL